MRRPLYAFAAGAFSLLPRVLSSGFGLCGMRLPGLRARAPRLRGSRVRGDGGFRGARDPRADGLRRRVARPVGATRVKVPVHRHVPVHGHVARHVHVSEGGPEEAAGSAPASPPAEPEAVAKPAPRRPPAEAPAPSGSGKVRGVKAPRPGPGVVIGAPPRAVEPARAKDDGA